MRSATGTALLFNFDEAGNPVFNRGFDMPIQGWLLEYGSVFPEDAILLVEHHIADDGRLMMKCLDSGLLRDGRRKVPVAELIAQGRIFEMAKKARDEYVGRMF
jgi:hypothetical protein